MRNGNDFIFENDEVLIVSDSDLGYIYIEMIKDYDTYDGKLTREEAIPLARAILAHYNVGVE